MANLFYRYRNFDRRAWRRYLEPLWRELSPSEQNVYQAMHDGDEVARLTFADICEEHGHEAFARFVREQLVTDKRDRDRDDFPLRKRRKKKV